LPDARHLQTWALYGGHYRLPLLVEWLDFQFMLAKVRLHPGIPWLAVWRETALEPLHRLAVNWEAEPLAFFMERDSLAEVAVPCEVSDPEALVRWAPDEAVYELDLKEDYAMGRDPKMAVRVRQFLKGLVDTLGLCGFESFEELELFYYLLTNYMARWLQTRGEPLELIFARLFATPLRPSWWQENRGQEKYGAWRYTKQGQLLMGEQQRPRRKPKEGTIIPWVIHWRVELIENRRWLETSRKVEEKKLAKLTPFGYVKSSRERLFNLLALLDETYELRQTQDEKGYSTSNPLPGDAAIGPVTGKLKRKRRPASARRLAQLARATAASPVTKPRQPPAMVSPDAGVPAVPDLPQRHEDAIKWLQRGPKSRAKAHLRNRRGNDD